MTGGLRQYGAKVVQMVSGRFCVLIMCEGDLLHVVDVTESPECSTITNRAQAMEVARRLMKNFVSEMRGRGVQTTDIFEPATSVKN